MTVELDERGFGIQFVMFVQIVSYVFSLYRWYMVDYGMMFELIWALVPFANILYALPVWIDVLVWAWEQLVFIFSG